MDTVKVYGADWCGDTRRSRALLDGLGVQYEYIDIDASPEAVEYVKEQSGGKRRIPVVEFSGQNLVVPANSELEQALRGTGMVQ